MQCFIIAKCSDLNIRSNLTIDKSKVLFVDMQMVKSNHLVTVGKFILHPQKSPFDQGGQSGNYLAKVHTRLEY